uniref:C2H2-type domain-containing protein n=1 Tax=Anopheles epiroticus TaxID=199890 RepID=A0A182PQT9_9DIPT
IEKARKRPSEKIKTTCQQCGKVLSSQQTLRIHITLRHGTDEQFVIPAPSRAATAPVDDLRQCQKCGALVNGASGLANHTCNPTKNEKNATTVIQHRKNVNDLYECELCVEKIKHKLYFQAHLAKHTELSLKSSNRCDKKKNLIS